jgi:hypothetical protein
MKRASLIIALFAFTLSACGSQIAERMPFIVTVSPMPSPEITRIALATPTAETPSDTPAPTFTSAPTGTITPTETLIPPVEIPTEATNAPARMNWIGEVTYPGDSQPNTMFQLTYDPDVWAQTLDQFNVIVLAHRKIEYCTIAPYAGRGVPMNWSVERETRTIGALEFEVSRISDNGVPQFVTYVGGDKIIYTGFQVTFVDQRETCLGAAEAVLSTLRSIEATPTPEPTSTP